MMRLGGPVEGYSSPEEWVKRLKEKGYSAALCPVGPDNGEDVEKDYAAAAAEAGIVIAEAGAWCNPISPDEEERTNSLEKCRQMLALADRIGARCCVNVAGSRGTRWAGPDPRNLTDETFDMIVECVRSIIDEVGPTRSFYSLETMPWMYPDSAESYAWLIEAVDRKQFAVHFDPVNLICSPQRYFANGELVRDFIARLGPQIRSVHAKDVLMSGGLTTHIDEVRPGKGTLDYAVLLKEVDKLHPDTPVMLEHLPSQEEYDFAAEYIRSVAAKEDLAFV